MPLEGRIFQGEPRIKTWRWLKSYMNARFFRDLFFEEELLEEKSLVVQ